MIYLDSSALLKLLVEESESASLADWLASRRDRTSVSSELVRLEVVRAARRLDAGAVPAARALVSQLDLVPLNGSVLDQAGEVGSALLRSLDAIHLVSALSLAAHLSAFVAYDRRLSDAARGAGLPVTQPGVSTG